MTPEEKAAYEAAVKAAKEATAPLIERKALPDKIPARKDLQ
jgi:hypothetical protein